MKKKIKTPISQLVIIILSITFNYSFSQSNTQEISLRIVNEKAEPLSNVKIYSQEGKSVSYTNDEGHITFLSEPDKNILIEKKGYKSVVSIAGNLIGRDLTLIQEQYMSSENDRIKLPFYTRTRRTDVSAVYHLKTADIESFDATQNYATVLSARALGTFGGRNIRGLGYVIVVDGLVRDGLLGDNFSDMLNMQEIEEITVMKDPLSRALYGSYADKGVIMIKTKRGQAYKRSISFNSESGIGIPISYPKYMNASDYMRFYNEAWLNDGNDTPYYSAEIIESTANKLDAVRYPDQDFYSSEFLKDFRPTNRITMDFSGGNSAAQYYFNASVNQTSSLLKLGQENRSDYQYNLRGNADVRVNSFIKVSIDALGMFTANNNPYYSGGNFWEKASLIRPNEFAHLIPVERIVNADRNLVGSARLVNESYLLGGSSVFQDNIYGDFLLGGYTQRTQRFSQFNLGLDINLGALLNGLTFRTYGGIDNYNVFSENQENSFAVYVPTFLENDSISIVQLGNNRFSGSQAIRDINHIRRLGMYNVLNYKQTFNDLHQVDFTAMQLMDYYKHGGMLSSDRGANYGLRLNYILNKKYLAEFSGSLTGSMRFPKGNRWGVAPSMGIGWIVSEESFMENSPFHFLKIKASAGNIVTDLDDGFVSHLMYKDTYFLGARVFYNDINFNNRIRMDNSGNPDLTLIKRREYNAGFEAALLNGALYLEGNYFSSTRYNEIARRTDAYPDILGGLDFVSYENFGSRRINGFELGLNHFTQINEWTIRTGINVINYNSRIIEIDEPFYGEGNEHRQRAGKPIDSRFGLVFDGFYSEEDIMALNDPNNNNIPVPSFGTVKPGDVKYRDINNDGIIDLNDLSPIGNWHPRFDYNLNLGVGFRGFDLFTFISAQTGSTAMDNDAYYWVFGDRKYPQHIENRWAHYTDQDGNLIDTRATAKYPRLTTGASNNNFRNSTLWQRSNDFLRVPLAQLTYTLPDNVTERFSMKNLSVYVRATNILTISSDNERMLLNVGTSPQFRSYSAGIKANL